MIEIPVAPPSTMSGCIYAHGKDIRLPSTGFTPDKHGWVNLKDVCDKLVVKGGPKIIKATLMARTIAFSEIGAWTEIIRQLKKGIKYDGSTDGNENDRIDKLADARRARKAWRRWLKDITTQIETVEYGRPVFRRK